MARAHYHINVQTEGGYLPFNDDPGYYETREEAEAEARVEAEWRANDDEGLLSVVDVGNGIYIIEDSERINDNTYLRTFVSVDECDEPDCRPNDN